MTAKKKPPGEYSAFRRLLEKLVNVPKREIDAKEAEYQRGREIKKRKRA